jgi:hypothetical protein
MVNGSLKGIFLMAPHQGYVNGEPKKIYYLGNAFIAPEMRRKAFIANAGAEFFNGQEAMPELGYSLIMKKNARAENYIGKTSPDYPLLPNSRVIADFVGRSVPLIMPKKYKGEYEIRPATEADIPYLASSLDERSRTMTFGQIYTATTIEELVRKRPGFNISNFKIALRNGSPAGFCSAWDSSPIRQTRVLHFGKKFFPVLALYRLISAFTAIPPLPANGEQFREMHIGHVCIEDNDPRIFEALLRYIYQEAREAGMHIMLWGSYDKDPLLAAMRSFRGVEIRSSIVAISTKKELLEQALPNPFIDTAFL